MRTITINERVKELRKIKNIKQGEVAKRIGIKQGSLSDIENGRVNVSDRVIKDLCREYNVSELWLRTGDGDIFEQHNRNQEWGITIGRILANENEFARKTFEGLSLFDDSDWQSLKTLLDSIYKKNE